MKDRFYDKSLEHKIAQTEIERLNDTINEMKVAAILERERKKQKLTK